jgi:TolB-like protein/rhodanese-related sulfurtransferase/predicted Zn-dependent protease
MKIFYTPLNRTAGILDINMASQSKQAFPLLSELRRRHVFRVAALYIVGAWLLLQIADVTFPGLSIPEAAIRYVMIAVLVGFPIALVIGWMYQFTHGRIVRTPRHSESASVSDLSLRGADYLILGALMLTAISVTYGLIVSLGGVVEMEAASVEDMAFPLPDKPSIAVLPFDNISNDTDQDYFVDGITEDLITDLSKISGLFVIARNSAFTYKGRPVKVQEVAEELGVRYVLEGSVRKAGSSIRINAQLIDAVTGGHVWADRYDDGVDDIFALQDRITERIVSALEVNLTQAEQSADRGTTSPAAHDAFLRGWAHYRRNTPEAFVNAVSYLEQAIEHDPDYSLAYAALATIYWKALENSDSSMSDAWYAFHWYPFQESSWEEERDRFAGYLARAMEDPGALAYQAMAIKYSLQGRHDQAVAEAKRAIAVDPNNPIGYEALATALIYLGRPDDGAEAIQTAMRLDPRYPHEYLFWLGLAQFNMQKFEQAVETLRLATQVDPGSIRALIVLAAAYGKLGRVEEARLTLEAQNLTRKTRAAQRPDSVVLRDGVDSALLGSLVLEDMDGWLFQEPSDRERLREGLRAAGVPEVGEGSDVSPLSVPGARSIDVNEAKQLYDRGVVFVDVRDLSSRDLGYIPGSIFLDLELNFTGQALSDVIDRDEAVVIYCAGHRCLRSSKAVEKAVSWGFTNIYYFRRGFFAWKVAGYPFDSD